jgi:acyl-CoA dehydrogenase
MTTELVISADTPEHAELRRDVRQLCDQFGEELWQQRDLNREYPEQFVATLTKAGYLSALIPTEYGGLGLGITEAACHAQMYTMAALLRHGSDEQKKRYLPEIASGNLLLQAFSITEPQAGSNTPDITSFAAKDGDHYVVTGHKNWTSRIEQSDLLMLLARTEKRADDPADRARGISLFLADLREVRANRPETFVVEPVRTMFNYATNQVWYKQMRIQTSALIGEEGRGFRYVIDGWNAERILLASEAIGDGYWFLDTAISYANERRVFGHAIGANQGVQFPLARAYTQVLAADMMRNRAAALFDAGKNAARKPTRPSSSRPRPVGRPATSASTCTADTASSTSTTSNASSARRASIRSRPSTTT